MPMVNLSQICFILLLVSSDPKIFAECHCDLNKNILFQFLMSECIIIYMFYFYACATYSSGSLLFLS